MNTQRNGLTRVLARAVNAQMKLLGLETGLPIRGDINILVRHIDGTTETRAMRNLIMDAGEDEAAILLVGLTGDGFDYIAIGTDNTAPADSQTALGAEISTGGGARAQDATPETGAGTDADNVCKIDVTFNFTASFAIVEVGLFNASSAGDMFARQVFSVINVQNGDSMTVTWKITVGTAR